MVQHFGEGQHAFGLGADIHDDVGAGDLQHGALDDVVLAGGFFALGSEAFERGGEVFSG